MINTTDEKALLESDEPAFMVLGATSYETPGDTPDAVKKTTVFMIRVNKAMNDEHNKLIARFCDADFRGEEEDEAYEELKRFRRDICERICSRHAELTRIDNDLAAIVWRRVKLKGGKK